MLIEGKELAVSEGALCGDALREALSGKKFKSVLACACGETLLDLTATIPAGCAELTPVYADSPQGLQLLRHSTAHIMAEAVQRLFPGAKVTIGPAIDSGFYYDFDYERAFSIEDLPAIEAEMAKIVAANEPFSREVVSKDEAVALFSGMGEDYKVELIREITDETVSLYRCGKFVDLCRGPHIPHTGLAGAFKLLSVAGAYWRGDEKNRMLSRIYGTAFADKKDLDKHLQHLEEAKRRDHRKLGRELDLFDFHDDVAPGMVYWHPKGMLLRTILEDYIRKEHLKRGYELVQGPQLLRRELWERSGHYDNYRENMYFTEIDEAAYGIKPMNCLSHMLIYRSKIRSYRELPVKYFELGVVHRHEKSGVLHGLLRVRQFTQDDAHLLCRPDQLEEEVIKIVKFAMDILNLFDFEYVMTISTKPAKAIGTDEDWERATKALMGALDNMGIVYRINEGDGAFYGPKIDIQLKDAIGRMWQCSTIQCDFTLPERFDLSYTGQDGERHRPVMLHRALLGSVERFIGVLTEHFAGAYPLWLAPVQAKIVTVTDAQAEFAEKVKDALLERGVRVEADLRNEKLGYKIREAQVHKIPYMLVIGDKEVENGGVSVRPRVGEDMGFMSVDEFASQVRAECQEPFKRGGMHYSFS